MVIIIMAIFCHFMARGSFSGGDVRDVLACARIRIERLVFVEAICDGHEVVLLVIDQAVVPLGKGVVHDLEAVAHTVVFTVDHQRRHGKFDDRIEGVVHELYRAATLFNSLVRKYLSRARHTRHMLALLNDQIKIFKMRRKRKKKLRKLQKKTATQHRVALKCF